MKHLIPLIVLVGAALPVHAQLLTTPGTKATISVEYAYSAVGSKPDKYDPREWRVNRGATFTTVYEAQASQPMPQLRPLDSTQLANLKDKQTTAEGAAKKMKPMMDDVMKIVEKCGEDEACIERQIAAYGTTAEITPEIRSAGDDIRKLSRQDGPRYQLWRSVSQTGTYFIDESYKAQTADPACMEKPQARCRREETRKGGGDLVLPKGNKGADLSLFEVDAQNKDILIRLPAPLLPMSYSRVVKSDYPDESNGSTQGMMGPGLGQPKEITVAIPADLKRLSGTQQVKLTGAEGEGGTLTVRWTITVP